MDQYGILICFTVLPPGEGTGPIRKSGKMKRKSTQTEITSLINYILILHIYVIAMDLGKNTIRQPKKQILQILSWKPQRIKYSNKGAAKEQVDL